MQADPIFQMVTGKAAPYLELGVPRPWSDEDSSDKIFNAMLIILGDLMLKLNLEKADSGQDPKSPWFTFRDRGYPGTLSEVQKVYKQNLEYKHIPGDTSLVEGQQVSSYSQVQLTPLLLFQNQDQVIDSSNQIVEKADLQEMDNGEIGLLYKEFMI